MDDWLAQPNARLVEPGPDSWQRLGAVCEQSGVAGATVMDAHLVVLAAAHDAVIATADRDFRRFPTIRTVNPIN